MYEDEPPQGASTSQEEPESGNKTSTSQEETKTEDVSPCDAARAWLVKSEEAALQDGLVC